MLKIDIVASEDVALDVLNYLMRHFKEEPTCVYGGRDSDMVDKHGVELMNIHILFEE